MNRGATILTTLCIAATAALPVHSATDTPPLPNLKQCPPEARVKSIRYCGDAYFITTATEKTSRYEAYDLRFKTDSGTNGPAKGKPVTVISARGDRITVVFAGPKEISRSIQQRCE